MAEEAAEDNPRAPCNKGRGGDCAPYDEPPQATDLVRVPSMAAAAHHTRHDNRSEVVAVVSDGVAVVVDKIDNHAGATSRAKGVAGAMVANNSSDHKRLELVAWAPREGQAGSLVTNASNWAAIDLDGVSLVAAVAAELVLLTVAIDAAARRWRNNLAA